MSERAVRLSKSRFTAGLQCHKQLWWRVHEPHAVELEPDRVLRARLEAGRRVGEVARGYVPEGVLIDSHAELARRVAATAAAVAGGAPAIYEAAFVADDTIVAVDILERQSAADDGWCVIEVKSGTRVQPHHVADIALQAHVAARAGLTVGRAEVMHLNRECRYPDLSNLFTRADVTPLVHAFLLGVPDHIAAQLAVLAGPLPDVPVGEHCTTPRDCPFLARCWIELPPDHVGTLHGIRRQRARELLEQGYVTIPDLPADQELTAIQARQARALREGAMVVEPALAEALERFRGPLAYLDFETVSLPIPVWDGCRPYERVPVQFSCHVERSARGPGALQHHWWLTDGPGDPRPAQAVAVVRACEGVRMIVAYNAPFERDCLRALAAAAPHLEADLDAIAGKLVDLLPLVRNHIYHPEFGGTFSLKAVLPALVPDLSYEGLAIADGEVASVELARLMFEGDAMSDVERARLRRDLLAYCETDTLATVRVLEVVRGLGGPQLSLL